MLAPQAVYKFLNSCIFFFNILIIGKHKLKCPILSSVTMSTSPPRLAYKGLYCVRNYSTPNRTYLPCPSDVAGDANVDRESRLLRSTRGEKNKYYIKTERCNHVRFQDKPSVMTAIPETQNSSPSLSLIKSSQVRL